VDEEVIPVLYVEDAARAVDWYRRLGFEKQREHQFEPGLPWFVSVARGRVRLYLSEHKGDARPNTLIHLNVTDIDTVSREFGIPVDEDGPGSGVIPARWSRRGFTLQLGSSGNT
jgi:catechol 2,3-dioxygenase-like lactoylglutathione lyase family enzyme